MKSEKELELDLREKQLLEKEYDFRQRDERKKHDLQMLEADINERAMKLETREASLMSRSAVAGVATNCINYMYLDEGAVDSMPTRRFRGSVNDIQKANAETVVENISEEDVRITDDMRYSYGCGGIF